MSLFDRVKAAKAAAALSVEMRNGKALSGRSAFVALGSRWNTSPDHFLIADRAGRTTGSEKILFTSGADIGLFQIPGMITELVSYQEGATVRDLLYAGRRLTDLFWKWRVNEALALDGESLRAWHLLRDYASEPDGWPQVRLVGPEL